MTASGVYAFTSPSGGQYIGQSADLNRRKRDHLCTLRRGTSFNRCLQNAFDKYGEANLKFTVLVLCEPVDLVHWEQHFIDTLKPRYNLAPVAGSVLGVKRTADQKSRYGAASKRMWADAENRAKIVAAARAVWMDPDFKARRLAVLLKASQTDASKAKIRAAQEAYWANPEIKARRSESAKQVWARPGAKEHHARKLTEAHKRPDVKARRVAAAKIQGAVQMHTPEVLARRRAVQNSAAFRACSSANAKARWTDPEMRALNVAAMNTPESKTRRSAAKKAMWSDPVKRARMLAAQRAAQVARNAAAISRGVS